MYEETSYFCPMVNREMWDSECYDIQMVHYDFIDESILDFVFEKEKSDSFCDKCPFNQLKQSATIISGVNN